ncbi:MAG TPA: hypothetical protein VN915_06350 [Elusimicrobiota bacterium]|nr:hypothetical protein [Elusimicrobiota bacterium]
MLSRLLLPLLIALLPASARAEDWLVTAQKTAATTAIAGEPVPDAPKKDWVPYEPASRLFRADLPPVGWNAFEEEDALGTVVRILGPDDPSGALRASLTVRLVDRDSPAFAPAKQAVEGMRRGGPGREATQVRSIRIGAGLARIFEITESRRVPVESGVSSSMELHQYVAVIPRGEAYYVVRLVSARSNYLDYRDDFMRFLKSLKPVGAR